MVLMACQSRSLYPIVTDCYKEGEKRLNRICEEVWGVEEKLSEAVECRNCSIEANTTSLLQNSNGGHAGQLSGGMLE